MSRNDTTLIPTMGELLGGLVGAVGVFLVIGLFAAIFGGTA